MVGNEDLFGESAKIFPLYKLLEFRKGTIVLVEVCAYVHELITENKVLISILLRSSINCLEHLLNPMVLSNKFSGILLLLLSPGYVLKVSISWPYFL